MKHRYVFGLFLTALSLVSAVPRVHAQTSGIILSEIAWAGSEKSAADEWIELANMGSGDVSVAGWRLTGVGTSGSVLIIPDGATIPAGGTYLIANYKMGSSSTLSVAPDDVTTAVSIPNTALNVSLLDQTGTVVDSLVDPGTPNAGSSTTFSTMERASDSTWMTAEVSTNLLNGQLGSPGVAGHQNAPVAEVAAPIVETAPATTPSDQSPRPASGSSSAINEGEITTAAPAAETVLVEAAPVETLPTETTESTVSSISSPTETVAPVIIETTAPAVVPESETTPIVTDSAPTVSQAIEAPVITETPVIETVSDSEPTTANDQQPTHSPLIISAFLAAPSSGGNEWIEITNTGDTDLDVSSYSIIDATGKATSLTGVIAAGSTAVITNPKGALNNDGDTIAILNATGLPIDEVIYGTADIAAPKKDGALRLVNGAWTSETQTTDAESIISTLADTVVTETVAADISSAEAVSTTLPDTAATTEIIVAESTPSSVATVPEDVPLSSIEVLDLTSASDAISSTTSDAQRTTTVTLSPGDLVISALLPSPTAGDGEWVAITNMTDAAIDLSTVSIVDASGTETALSGSIDAGATVYVSNPKGKLNNDGDRIALLVSGTTLDVVSYGTQEHPAPKKGETIFFSPTLTYDISPVETPATTKSASTALATAAPSNTKTHANPVASTSPTTTSAHSVRTTAPRVSTTSTRTATTRRSSTTKTVAAKNVSVDEIDQLANDTNVSLEGIVVAAPGTISKRSFFLDGLEIYQNQGDLADVHIGDHVRIAGSVSVLSDHRRVNIKADTVTALGTATPVAHEYNATLRYGSLAHATGTVSARSGNDAILALDNGSQLTLTAANGVLVHWSDFAGKHISVSGILKSIPDNATLVIRNAEDIVVDAAQTETPIAAGTTDSSFPWLGVAFGALTAAGLGFWFWKTRPATSRTLTLNPSTL